MKKIISIILISLLLYGCGGYVMKYDEEQVKEQSLKYLEGKYGGSYEFSNSSSPAGSNFVQISFKDLDRSDDEGTMFIIVIWYEDSGVMSDYEDYMPKTMDYDEDKVKKEALEYLENKYDEEFEFRWCMAHPDYVDVVFDVVDKTKQNTVTVKWREDGVMTDNFKE
ncbi:hypothetical protein M2475_000870 [Breznakia sp. PF5-3]|uniref:hypothetical protein n=1 Tax=unclassified Breznakia TaxID=2623764 RepID=UPI0024065360|nr:MULTISPECIES: hypothetical protein [unclassified Breznakia]MDF9824519.1 hypothetical protein [Breznakia sp. PM6-1]MDF9835305.1 hypothetical protein [Breznakia sp. PF5-3]MDF9837021.1 hypothetical protein [Breznakia sp. PFB2-8]MDF9858946.1 hypothetical protein [Breznakia sp. PH5-24]